MIFTNGLLEMILIFSRVAATFAMVPVFGAKNSPATVKVGLILFLTVTLFPLVEPVPEFEILTLIELGYNMVIEILIGLSIGLVVTLMMNAIYLSGLLIDRNIGFAMVSVMSAQDEGQIPVSANFFYLMVMIIFLMTDAHHKVIEAVYYSLKVIPIGGGVLNVETSGVFLNIVSNSFVIGFKIAAPFILTVFIVNVILGLLSKAMPGLNVFMVGMPIKVLVGLTLFYLLIPTYFGIFDNMLDIIFEHMYDLINLYL